MYCLMNMDGPPCCPNRSTINFSERPGLSVSSRSLGPLARLFPFGGLFEPHPNSTYSILDPRPSVFIFLHGDAYTGS